MFFMTRQRSERVYPGRPDSVGVALRSIGQDATLAWLDAWTMASIYR